MSQETEKLERARMLAKELFELCKEPMVCLCIANYFHSQTEWDTTHADYGDVIDPLGIGDSEKVGTLMRLPDLNCEIVADGDNIVRKWELSE